MRSTVEREVKLGVPEGFALPDLGGEPLEPRTFVSTYLDTDDLRLLRSGATLRCRVENEDVRWHLKLPHDGDRLELEVGGPPERPPDELARLLPALLQRRALDTVVRLRTRRAGSRIRMEGAVADVTLDSVAVVDGQRVVRTFEEVEVELVDGDPDALGPVVKQLRGAGAGKREVRPKLAQALELAPARPPAADGATLVGALAQTLRRQLEQLRSHDPAARLHDDPEDVHQLRVATRRSRAALRAARDFVVPEWGEALAGELKWFADRLGRVRDADVLAAHLREEADALDSPEGNSFASAYERLREEREQSRSELLRAMDCDRYLDLLETLERASDAPRVFGDAPRPDELWRREVTRLRRDAAELLEPPSDEQLHSLRIRAKRARYAAELAEDLLGKRGRRFVAAAKQLQDVLGEHQDAAVAEARIRALVEPREPWLSHFVAGRLVQRQLERRCAARAAFPNAWSALERAADRAGR